MTDRYDVIVAGDYYLDLVFTGLPCLPEPGREVVGTGFDMLPGGAFNSAVAMHRLGLRVGWAADFGNDDFSRFALQQAAAEGLDDSLFVHHQRPLRRITVACSYPAERAFITYVDPEPAVPAVMKALARTSARLLFVGGLYYGRFFQVGLLAVRARGMKLAMDGNSPEGETLANPALRKAIAGVDLFLPNAMEARRLTGEADVVKACRVLAGLGPLVAVKDGAYGSYACLGDRSSQVLHVPALPLTPVDTTGAGDCFDAGFITAWLAGRPLADCLRWGNVVGGLSTLARGGTGRRVTVEEVSQQLAALGSCDET